MKSKEQIEKLQNFIGYLNDGNFMNKEYRRGILDTLMFVLNDWETPLDKIHKQFRECLYCSGKDSWVSLEDHNKYMEMEKQKIELQYLKCPKCKEIVKGKK